VIRISWDTAYAGSMPIERYEVLRNEEVIATVPHRPQITGKRFYYDDAQKGDGKTGTNSYAVRSVDAAANTAQSGSYRTGS